MKLLNKINENAKAALIASTFFAIVMVLNATAWF